MVAHAEVGLLMLTQPVRRLIAGGAGAGNVHQDLQPVQVVRGFLAEKLIVQHFHVGYQLDVVAQPAHQFQCVAEQFAPVLDHLPPPAVERRVHHHVRARGHQQVRAGRQPVPVDEIALHVEDRPLLESGAHLVHAHHTHVGARVHRPRW
jgi:hypothetical protein